MTCTVCGDLHLLLPVVLLGLLPIDREYVCVIRAQLRRHKWRHLDHEVRMCAVWCANCSGGVSA